MNITIQLNKRIRGFKKYYEVYADSVLVGDIFKMRSVDGWDFSLNSRFSGKKFIPREVLSLRFRNESITIDGHEIKRRSGDVDYWKHHKYLQSLGEDVRNSNNVYRMIVEKELVPEKIDGTFHGFDFESVEEALEIIKKVIEADYFENVPAGELKLYSC